MTIRRSSHGMYRECGVRAPLVGGHLPAATAARAAAIADTTAQEPNLASYLQTHELQLCPTFTESPDECRHCSFAHYTVLTSSARVRLREYGDIMLPSKEPGGCALPNQHCASCEIRCLGGVIGILQQGHKAGHFCPTASDVGFLGTQQPTYNGKQGRKGQTSCDTHSPHSLPG
jgi:hypothetical protein